MKRNLTNKLPFMAAFFVALAYMPLDIYDFHDREIGTAHAAPWRQKFGAAIQTAVTPVLALWAFLCRPQVRRATLAVAMLLLYVFFTDQHQQGTPLVFAAGLTLQEMREEKGRLANQADDILKKAKDEGRMDLREDEERQFDAIHVDIEKLNKRIQREEKQETVNASLAEPTGRRSEPPPAGSPGGGSQRILRPSATERLDAMRAWLLAGTPEGPSQDLRGIAQRCGLAVDHKSLTIRLSDTEAVRALREEGPAGWEKRAQSVGTGSAGGFTVPDEMMRELEVSLLAFGGMRQVATIIRTETGAALPIPTVNDTANKGEIIGENTTTNAQDTTFAQIVLDAYKYSSKYILVSVELLQDSSINVAAFLGRALAERIGRITNDHFTTGTGSSQPNGIVTASGAGVSSVADPPTYDNFVDLVHSVDPAYRVNAKFMLNDATLKTIKKIKVLQYSGDTIGMPLWAPGLTQGQPDTILGYSYVINQSMASPGSSAKKVLFGDLSKYLIRDVRDVTLLRLDERYAELHQVAFLAFSRHDGDLLDSGTDPVKYMAQA